MSVSKIVFTFTWLFIFATAVNAQDRYFASTYNSNVIPKGAIDLELWHKTRFGHKNQFYNAQDQRIEFEFGLGHNLQTSIYLNSYHTRFSDSKNGTRTISEIGISNEWKWKLSDPEANSIGFAMYGELGFKGGDELELETKLIADKIIEKNVIAFNASYEYEKEFDWEGGETESEDWAMPVEFDFGYQYLLKPTFGLGFEILDHNEFTKSQGLEHSVLFGGPTVNFRQGRWFAIINVLPQLSNIYKADSSPETMVLDAHERFEFRVLTGISF